ncbi:N-acetylglucosamine-6-phosphate deacetylase [Butyrivibrio sp. WCE2006]|uniref:N-acetylglucosamine-6-phosphate deacetylase n=1 Tax=Butyrivibrio sp. WCE2006 TaxID=1410611 RepID=UPI0005D1A8EE|nr:N-acetylglucosamine-6-phosphate deacetylase [Butyrivibrio sp. WCE2006]
MKISGALVYTKDHIFEEKDIFTKDQRISETSGDETELDAKGLLAIPGLVDIHFHGAVGHDFCDGDKKGLEEIAEYEAQNGVLAICPATMTFPEEVLSNVALNAKSYKEGIESDRTTPDNIKRADLVGINMEGPFISPDKIGAQNPDYLQLPDIDMFRRLQEKSGDLFKLVDIAPELPGSMEFIKEHSSDVKISLAHTCSDYDTAIKSFQNGAGHMTHLFNAMPGLNHRNPGPIAAAIECKAEAELIADGIHVHPAMVRFAFNAFPEDKMILISDSMEATGLPDGEYQLGGQKVTVIGNKAVLTDKPDVIAGSVTNLFDCMKNAVKNMGISLETAVRAASENPAKSIGIDADYGSIEPGKYANIILMDKDFNIKHIVNRGQLL